VDYIGLIPVHDATGEKILSLIDEEIKSCGRSLLTPPPSFEKPFTWRLVRGKVMFNILMKWEELKAYFTSAELAQL
jgi:hypothetical protein